MRSAKARPDDHRAGRRALRRDGRRTASRIDLAAARDDRDRWGDRLGSLRFNSRKISHAASPFFAGERERWPKEGSYGACCCPGHAKTCSAKHGASTSADINDLLVTGGCQARDGTGYWSNTSPLCFDGPKSWFKTECELSVPVSIKSDRRRQGNFYTDR